MTQHQSSSPPPQQHHTVTFPWVNLFSGVSSGLISTVLLQPLDVAKTQLINPLNQHKSLITTFYHMIQHDGVLSLWRGVKPAALRISIGAAIYFTTQSTLIQSMQPPLQQQQQQQQQHSAQKLSATTYMWIGALSRSAAVSLCCPISVVKTLQEASVASSPSINKQLLVVWQNEGMKGLYAGLIPSLVKDAPYAAVYLALYTSSKQQLSTLFDSPLESQPKFQQLLKDRHVSQSALLQFMSAGLASAAATTLFQPLDVIKTRLQLSAIKLSTTLPHSGVQRVLTIVRDVLHREGVSGLFRGLVPRVARRGLANAITFMLYEQLVQVAKGRTGL